MGGLPCDGCVTSHRKSANCESTINSGRFARAAPDVIALTSTEVRLRAISLPLLTIAPVAFWTSESAGFSSGSSVVSRTIARSSTGNGLSGPDSIFVTRMPSAVVGIGRNWMSAMNFFHSTTYSFRYISFTWLTSRASNRSRSAVAGPLGPSPSTQASSPPIDSASLSTSLLNPLR